MYLDNLNLSQSNVARFVQILQPLTIEQFCSQGIVLSGFVYKFLLGLSTSISKTLDWLTPSSQYNLYVQSLVDLDTPIIKFSKLNPKQSSFTIV